MELKDFVTTTIKELEQSLQDSESEKYRYTISYGGANIEGGIKFDLAVTSSQTSEGSASAGGGLKVKVISLEGAKGTKTTSSDQTVSRIMFTVRPDSKRS